MASASSFAARVIAWQRTHGRRGLPWQQTRDPYRIWLSEVMLQQTQVCAVVPYYDRFVARFPTVQSLAQGSLGEVLALWSGLGYYARARHLHETAQCLVREHGGRFPRSADELAQLKGIGRSTANAIAAFAYGARLPILDGNVKRILARHAGVDGYPGARAVERTLWELAHRRVPARASCAQMSAYTQGMMDLGSLVCTRSRPHCGACPVSEDCVAFLTHRVEEIPASRPKKVLPHRTRWIVTICTSNAVVLERRPARGIWGGLLSLPEFESEAQARAFLARVVPTAQIVADAPVQHAFTHYTLTLHPLRAFAAQVGDLSPIAAQTFALRAIAHEALPAPIKTYLLATLCPKPD